MTALVQEILEVAVPDFLGPEAIVLAVDGPSERDWSWQFSVRVAGPSGGDLLLKIPRWEETPTLDDAIGAGEQDATHAELDGLRRIELSVLSSGDPGLTAVEPIGYVARLNGILMRRLEGQPLRERLGVRRQSRDVAALFGRVGRWIAVFHAIDGPPQERLFDAGAAIEALHALERELPSGGRRPRGLLQSMALLRLAAENLDGVAEPWAETHGDLNISNVLVGIDDRVAVIDPNRVMSSALSDPVRVITDVLLERRQLVLGRLGRSASTVTEWEQSLFDASGYADEGLLAYRLAEAAVERWARLEVDLTGLARLGLIPGRFLARRIVKRRLSALS